MTLLERLRRLVFPDPAALDVLAAAERVPDAGRRQFLKLALAGAAVAATVDLEQLLWTPGKTFLLPAEPAWQTFTITQDCYSDAWDTCLPMSPEIAEKYIRPAAQRLSDDLDQMLLRSFEHSIRVSRKYADNFDRLKVGDTIQIRLPQQYVHNVAEKRLKARRVA